MSLVPLSRRCGDTILMRVPLYSYPGVFAVAGVLLVVGKDVLCTRFKHIVTVMAVAIRRSIVLD